MLAHAEAAARRRAPGGHPSSRTDGPAGSAQPGNPVPAPGHFCVERNVATLGLFTAAHARVRPGHPKMVPVARQDDGTRRFVTATIVPSATYGLPVTADQDKYFAFLFLVYSAVRGGAPLENPFQVCPSQLLSRLGLCTDSGKHYRAIREWLDVMTMTTIVSDESVYLAHRKCYVRDRFRVFDRAVSAGERLDDGTVADAHYVWLSSWQIDNLRHHHAVTVDLHRYCQLTRPISRALVPLLPLWLRAARDRGTFVKRYSDICALLGLRRYAHPSKIREKFAPALEELLGASYIGGWSLDLNADGDDFNISLELPRAPERSEKLTSPPDTSSDAPLLTAAPTPEVEALVARGVSRHAAIRLVSRLAPGQDITRQIAWFDRLIASPAGRGIRNPAGLLYRTIESGEQTEGLPQPGALNADGPAAGEVNRYELLQAYNRYLGEAVSEHISALPAHELERQLDEHLVAVLREDDRVRLWPPDQQRRAARHRLEKHLAKTLPVQRYCDFLAAHAHGAGQSDAGLS